MIARLCAAHAVELLVLTECASSDAELQSALSEAGLPGFTAASSPVGEVGGVRVLLRRQGATLVTAFEDGGRRQLIYRLVFPDEPEWLVGAFHLRGKGYATDADQAAGARRISEQIERIEEYLNHDRTIAVGDLNMNPFDLGMIGSEGFHGVMSRGIARRGSRKSFGNRKRLFFNPMWGLWGDRADGPPGTYYFAPGGRPIACHWHMFDQVLVRPSLMDRLSEVKIVEGLREVNLAKQSGVPNPSVGSDHFPVVFRIEG